MMENIMAKIIRYFEESGLASGLEVSAETNLKTDLGVDSLRLVEVIINMEEIFDIIIDESDLEPSNISKVNDLAAIIQNTLEKE